MRTFYTKNYGTWTFTQCVLETNMQLLHLL